MRGYAAAQRAWDARHPDDYRTAADDAAEQAAECMVDFDRREAERKARESADREEGKVV